MSAFFGSFLRVGVRGVVLLGFFAALTAVLLGGPAVAATELSGEQRLVNLVDADRGAHGLPALRVCGDLRDIARGWSVRMAADGRLSHNANLGGEVAGWRSVGENVGYDASVDAVHQRFVGSGPHRAHIRSNTYTEVGIGVERTGGRVWVTQVFREPDGSARCSPVAGDPEIAVACPPGAAPAGAFRDIRGNTHREAIDCGAWYGVVHGTGDGRYSPDRHLTRGQLATFVARLADHTQAQLPVARDQGFTDIAGSAHADAINRLAAVGIVEGTSASTYNPDGEVSRAQMATFFVRAYTFASDERLTARRDWFTDDDGLVHEPHINTAAQAGFVAGVSSTQYAPQHAVSRDQVASLLTRLLNRLVQRGEATRP